MRQIRGMQSPRPTSKGGKTSDIFYFDAENFMIDYWFKPSHGFLHNNGFQVRHWLSQWIVLIQSATKKNEGKKLNNNEIRRFPYQQREH